MKKTFTSLCLLLLSICASAQYVDKKEETTKKNRPLKEWRDIRSQLFNFGWKFQMGEVEGAEKTDFDDSQWRTLDLPHDFQFEMPWDEKAKGARAFKKMGSAWYRKTFNVPESYKGMSVDK